MTNLYGTGKNGKRLWMRSADNRWIEIPYGAGQDRNIRSVNIWNDKTKKWMTPTWGWTVWNRNGTHTQQIDSFDVRLPNRSWRGAATPTGQSPYYNPTYPSKTSTQPFTAAQPGWQRFFYLQDRVDPNWRIVPLGFKLPIHVPTTTVNYSSDEYLYFWPTGGLITRSQYQDRSGTPLDRTEIRNISGTESQLYLTETDYARSDPAFDKTTNFPYTETHQATLLDLKAIRQRLKDKYEQRGTDFVGQYAPIDKMKIRRIYVFATIGLSHGQIGTDPPQAALNSAQYRIYAKVGETATASASYTDPGYGWSNDGTYTVRNPTGYTPNGTVVYQKSGLDLQQQAVTPVLHQNPADPVRYQRNSYLNDTATFTFDNPGDDNITFYSTISGLPSLSAPAVDNWTAGLVLYTPRISIHFATDGHDTPVELHSPLALG